MFLLHNSLFHLFSVTFYKVCFDSTLIFNPLIFRIKKNLCSLIAPQPLLGQVGGTTLVPHTLNSTHYVPATMQGGGLRVTAGPSTSSVVGGGGVNGPGQVGEVPATQGTVPVPSMKPNSSPRPSILRKRPENDG